MMLWANLHGGFIFGLALIAPFAVEALIEAPAAERMATFVAWSRFGAVSVLAALATPFGIEGLLFPFQLMRLRSLDLIGEWRAPDLAAPGLVPAVLLAILALAVTGSARLNPVRAVTLAALCVLTILHERHEVLLAVVGAMLLAPALGSLARWTSPQATPPAAFWPILAPLALAIAAARLLHPLARAEDGVSPMAALAAVPPALRAEPVLNDYNFGGYLIFEGVKPYVDGRTDLYGDAFLKDFANLPFTPGALRETLERDHIGWTIFTPDRAIVRAMDREPGWRRAFANATAIVHVRTAP